MKTRDLIAIIFLLSTSFKGVCQSGYIGSLNNIEVKLDFGPSFGFVSSMEGDQTLYKSRFMFVDYQLNYFRTINNTFEIGLGYIFSNMKTNSFKFEIPISADDSYIILNDPNFLHHSFTFQFKKYRKGGITAAGKYLGLSASFGISNINQGEEVPYGWRTNLLEQSTFKEVFNYDIVDYYSFQEDVKMYSIYVHGKIGRSFPLTRKFVFVTGMSVPLFSYNWSNRGRVITTSLVSGLPKWYDSQDPSGIDEMYLNTIKKYNRLSFEFGLRFYM